MKNELKALRAILKGELKYDALYKSIYATDASVYRRTPIAVAFPKDQSDLVSLINFASEHSVSLVPRTAGTSLAGQCVGDGIIVDLSKHFTNILEFNAEELWIRVQPGVI